MFDPKKFGNIGSHVKSGSSYQVFSYLGDEDTLVTISAAGYFNSVKESLRRNDIVKVLDRTVSPAETYELRISTLPLSGDVETELAVAAAAEYFETVSKNLKSYPYELNYTVDQLTSIVYTTDTGMITKTFGYTGDQLTSIVLSGDTPSGIELTKTLSYSGETLTDVSYS